MKTPLIKTLLAMLACAMLLCACGQNPEPADEIRFDTEYPVEMKGTTFTAHNTYRTDYFRTESFPFNKDLALLSQAMARCNTIDEAFTTMGFDTQVKHVNGEDDGINRCSYFFARRFIDDYDLVAVVIDWGAYGMEWASNFTIGEKEEGKRSDHVGFSETAEWLYGNLKDYIVKNLGGRKLKIWISGYSRGADLTNCLTCRIIEKNEIAVEQRDIYAYGTESSRMIDADYVQEYQCLHNFVIDSDIIAAIPPASDAWGLERPGTTVVVSAVPDVINGYLRDITGEEESMPFTPDAEKYPTPEKFRDYLFDILLEKGKTPIEGVASFRSRQALYDTVQERLTYLLEVLMKNNKEGFDLVVDEIKKMAEDKGIFAVIALLSEEDDLYQFVSDILDDNYIPYDEVSLENGCSLFASLLSNTNLITELMNLLLEDLKIKQDVLENLEYLALCHYPEVVYLMLQHYGSN